MGISFGDLVEKSRDLVVDFGGNKLNLSYDPSALSPAKISRMNKELKQVDEDDDEAILGVAKMFCGIVKSWDLTGPLGEDENGAPLVEDGVVVPVEPEYVAWLPSPVIAHIIKMVGEDAAPKERKSR